jgi:DNA-binding MarR family transcriptional regulator
MDNTLPTDRHSEVLKDSLVAIVKTNAFDMTTRQLTIFLICYMNDGPHTVRGVAAALQIPKPTVSRAFDKLEHDNLLVRRRDKQDRRSIVVIRTAKGNRSFQELRASIAQADAKLRNYGSGTARAAA